MRLWQGKLPAASEEERIAVEPVDRFDNWADKVWREASESCALGAVRDLRALSVLYPEEDERFLRLKLSDRAGVIGWAVCLGTQLRKHKQFGNMRLGSIVDTLIVPGREKEALSAVIRFLAGLEIDLIVSNQLHQTYCKALEHGGLRPGPSNFGLAISPQLAARLEPLDESVSRFHFNRGDGDGPINL